MDYSTVPFNADRAGLLTVEQARQVLGATEPLAAVVFKTGVSPDDPAPVAVFEKDWAARSDEPTQGTQAWLTLADSSRYQLTFQSAQQLGSTCRINKGYQISVPSDLLEEHVNWWLSEGLGDRELKLLLAGMGADEAGRPVPLAVAQCRGPVVPFSNLQLLDTALSAIAERFGDDIAKGAFVDYKLFHDLEHTSVRIVLPGIQQVITGTEEEEDAWCFGIQFVNSIIGLKQTLIDGYLFRFASTGGAIDVAHSAGGFARRGAAPGDVYTWAGEAVGDVLDGVEEAFANVQALVGQDVAGDVVLVLNDLFREHSVPKVQRVRILEAMAETASLTMYDIVHAVTLAANMDELPWRQVCQLQETAGSIIHSVGARCDGHLPNGCRRLLPDGWEPAEAALQKPESFTSD